MPVTARVPDVGNVTLVLSVAVNCREYAPLVTKFPPNVIVLVPLFTPVPPYVPAIIEPCQIPVPMVPTLVKLDVTTLDPSVVALSTDVLLILKTLPVARFQFSLLVQLSFKSSQIIVLSVVPLRVMPPPSAVTSLGLATDPISIFLSSTDIVVELTVVVVPLTVRSPETIKLLLTVVVPVPAPIESVVAAPNAFTVVETVLNTFAVVSVLLIVLKVLTSPVNVEIPLVSMVNLVVDVCSTIPEDPTCPVLISTDPPVAFPVLRPP